MYEHQKYPKWVYKGGDGKIVANEAAHEDAKADGYGDMGAEAKKVEMPVEKVEPKIDDPISPIDAMDKSALAVYAKEKHGVDINKRKGIAKLRTEVKLLEPAE